MDRKAERVHIVVKLELDGEPEEVGLLLAQLGETLLGEQQPQEQQQGEETNTAWWTPERAAAFVNELTDTALRALSLIAERAPKVPFREVQREMGMPGLRLAGSLSSIGFAVARLGGPVPFARDYYQRAYYMDPDVAKVLTQAIAREQSERDQTGRHVGPAGGPAR